jgi:hypothetical protein
MMNAVLWAIQACLAAAFLFAGGTKLAKDRAALLADSRMAWANDFSPSQIRLIGLAEVLGAIGLIAPRATHTLPVLTVIAAASLAVLMIGAAFTHLRRHEPGTPALTLAALSAAVAIGRFALA